MEPWTGRTHREYCHKSETVSDVNIHTNESRPGIVCWLCPMLQHFTDSNPHILPMFRSFTTSSRGKMLRHMWVHRRLGHKVPTGASHDLLRDRARWGDTIL